MYSNDGYTTPILPPTVSTFKLLGSEVKQLVSLQVGELLVTLKAPGDQYYAKRDVLQLVKGSVVLYQR